MKEHQGLLTNEFQPIKQKYFLHEKENLRLDPFVESLQEYFQIFRRRIILHIFLSFFFLALMIPSVILQAEYIEFDVSRNATFFKLDQTWDPPISIQIFSKTDILLLDVQLFLDEKKINEFTIYERLYINTEYKLTINQLFNEAAVRLMEQFNFVPRSYLIIVIVMVVLSLLYSILTYTRYKKL